AKEIDKRIPQLKLVAVCDRNEVKTGKLIESLNQKPDLTTLDEVIEASDLVIEAASAKIAAELVEKAINRGKDIMVMSVGGLVDSLDLFEKVKEKECRVYFPSGAIAGLDAIKGAKESRIDSVTLTTYKSPSALQGAPYLARKGIKLSEIKEKTVLFEGSCREAVKAFPQNINVAASLAFAGVGLEKTRVRVVVDPALKRNVHQIVVEGDFGRLETRTQNLPSPNNPKTSYLAVLSAIATLKGIVNPLKVGT
ncbi:MAG: aspartate dehydrogenase, partial [Candidatus Aerophobus sp.]